MRDYIELEASFELRFEHEVFRAEAWGNNSIRVRIGNHQIQDSLPGALEGRPDSGDTTVSWDGKTARLVNGLASIEAAVDGGDGKPLINARFLNSVTGEEVLSERREHFWWPGAHVLYGDGTGSYEVHQNFAAYPDEKIYGLGQHTHGFLNQKGLGIDLMQRNGEVAIPFLLSNRGYGFLWNNPAVGRVDFHNDSTRWTANQTRQIDYWVTIDETPANILNNYSAVVGRAPNLPEWASGVWQSKLRYLSQDELLGVAREYRERELPLSVIVTDFFHWTAMGDFQFDPDEYPDPDAMIHELDLMNVKLMVSVWPTISPLSDNFNEMSAKGYLVGVDQGVPFHQWIEDKKMPRDLPVAFYDSTNPDARSYVWEKCKRNYFNRGVRVWWLDACEPELMPAHPRNLTFFAGPGAEVMNLYPRENARAFYEGSTSAGVSDIVLLCRSAWAGQAKYGAAVWSGDIAPTWESLAAQVRAGLNIGIAGIPWWTTDIGGFHGGDPNDEDYRELVIRWFQYGLFCPLFRLHGHREPRDYGAGASGGPNEPWSFGKKAYPIISSVLHTRERLRGYIHQQMDKAHKYGLPPMRPLFVDFPGDEAAWDVEDEFLFGDQLLIAPILTPQTFNREVYLPAGASWTEVHEGVTYPGGQVASVAAPLEYIPVFARDGAKLPIE